MLTSLQVRNFAIIDQVDVVFASGMTVLTGETGAGKSILVDALALVLGERGSAGLVREGAERAEICAEFDISKHKPASAWLAEQALDMDDACVLRRVIGADGRSRAFINGSTATLQSLATLGALLLDIHGQHFHQSLGRREVQRDLLDHFGKLTEQRNTVAAAWTSWHELAAELTSLEEDDADRASRIDLLEFQLDELEVLDLKADELNELHAERKKLHYSERIADGVAEALQLIFEADPDNAHRLLAKAQQSLQPLGEFDKNLAAAVALLSESVIQVAEAADQLQRCADNLDADPARRDWIEERLDAVQSIARKHRIEPEALGDLRERIAQQLDDLRNAKQRGEQLEERVAKAWGDYESQARILSKGRQQAAKKLSAAVTAAMADLGMPGGVFEVTLKPRAAADARAWGLEDAEYLISANPGQRPMPLTKVASGGELSRMSLSIQVIASDGSAIPTMIFDEVDSGVGGSVAEMVGRRLRELADRRQVLCVTHLPQVASQAGRHLRVNKITDGKSTRTTVTVLKKDERIEELARMLGGVEITKRTRDHAAEMLGKVGGVRKKRKRNAG